MKISKSALLAALQAASIGLSSKEMIEQSTSIIFTDGGIYTYNDEIAVFYPLEEIDFSGAVSSKELLAFVNKVKGDEISLKLNPENEAEILLSSGRSKAGLIIAAEIRLPKLEYPKKFTKLPNDFIDAIKYTYGTAGSNFTEPILTNICVSANEVVSSDRFRLAKYTLSSPIQIEGQILLPAHQIIKIARLNITTFAIDEGWIHFQTKEHGVVSCRTFEDRFPNYAPLLQYNEDLKIEFPKDLKEILDRAQIFSQDLSAGTNVIEVEIRNTKLTINARSESGWFSENIRCDYKGEKVEFIIAPSSLEKILQKTRTAYIDNNKIIFTEGNLFYMSIMKLS